MAWLQLWHGLLFWLRSWMLYFVSLVPSILFALIPPTPPLLQTNSPSHRASWSLRETVTLEHVVPPRVKLGTRKHSFGHGALALYCHENSGSVSLVRICPIMTVW